DVERGRVALFTAGAGVCVPGTDGVRIVTELAPRDGEWIIRKRRFSAFFQTELDMVLRRLGVQTLLITGTQYPNCIRGAAVDAMSLDYRAVVITDACSAQTEAIAAANILDMRNMGITCVPLAELDTVLTPESSRHA
ncbi:MAG: isochorismatase family cysteine hydrolase, partial [Bilophila sp.]